jgi:voltage-dependent potassium channel beta subunit
MEYRRLGSSGLRVSAFGFGSWVTFGDKIGTSQALECLSAARDAGVNFFDNAESYAGGKAEEIMGQAFIDLGWPRYSYVVSTKLFWGIRDDINMRNTLNRKYLMQGIDGSLERFQLDFVDILFCHRADPSTPLEETVWAMNDIIASGKALYWGTSQWPAADIRAAIEIAERLHLRKPVVEQTEYNLVSRDLVEVEYARLYKDTGYGVTAFSPLAQGLLTGKYLDGVPAGSRASLAGYEWVDRIVRDPGNIDKAAQLKAVADQVGCPMSQLAIAWCLRNPNVVSVVLGASSIEQLRANLAALDVIPLITDDVAEKLGAISPPE